MADYDLKSDEVLLLKETSVSSRGDLKSLGDLILTNLNLVFIAKSAILGRVVGVYASPLKDIKVYNDEPQIRITNGDLEIQFLDSIERFYLGNKVLTGNWARFMRMTRNGETRVKEYREKEYSKTKALPGTKFVAGKLKGTIDVFSDTFGIGKHANQKIAQEMTVKCYNCGAKMTGMSGTKMKCAYCGNMQVIG
ncbi:hypothetical protein [Weissella confusa]|uniref:hypothetical protein n=1 Tax=Weissella confusa TaxID=1583 RepID=UPI001081F996|nr:hypothetical protein [Weissella confusa]MED4273929.1 hypothetical protein [Weissella confusa]TGE70419.1 hypothetical protein C6P15_04680 [Weissella confusa]